VSSFKTVIPKPIRVVVVGLALAALSVPLCAAGASAAPASDSVAKPGFRAGTWSGKGVISGRSDEYGQLIRTSGKATFTLKVTKRGHVSGSGRWVRTDAGSGAISSTMRSVASVGFGGTATAPTYAGTQTVTTSFSDGARGDGGSFTRPFRGALRITRAGHCRVTGSSTVEGVTFRWTALLDGSGTCNT
jgi:hypothetical protein